MEKEVYIFQVQELLGHLRKDSDMCKPILELLFKEMKEHELSFADIGTSEEEINTFKVNCCKQTAQMYLEILRERCKYSSRVIDYIEKSLYEALKEGGFSLSEIGATQDEVESLIQLCTEG